MPQSRTALGCVAPPVDRFGNIVYLTLPFARRWHEEGSEACRSGGVLVKSI
jgi:hypothetical protein